MGMGAYDESEQQRREEAKSVDDENTEQISTDSYDGDVSYETPESADELMENFKKNKSS
ncbi:MAG: DUF5786 family protein [Halobacteria archaeon]|nr:DUF5786 family protein [Halobacteria archaeon]